MMRKQMLRFFMAALIGVLLQPLQSAAQCPVTGMPVQGAAPNPALLFPDDNWWNLDISNAPVDTGSANFINFINNGGTRRLHPDFGGEASPGSVDIYGMPYVLVDGNLQPKQAVTFQYWDESDGVDYATGQGIPFYPIPAEAITQKHWIEGGAPGNVDQRNTGDRHLLIIDCSNDKLYELYNVYYNTAQGKWYAGSGAFFDLKSNARRPEGWTSADAAGLAIMPGLVRYDDVYGTLPAEEIRHAFRVTVRTTNGYVYPASHRAGSTIGALPMGARLRLKSSVNGIDPALRSSDPYMQKIFRAMQKYGLIVADNGTDMYITGTFDTRWNNDILNPAFALLSAGDFEVVQLGWNPPAGAPALNSVSASPNTVVGGNPMIGTVVLTSAAPSDGISVSLSSASPVFSVPGSVTVAGGATAATFAIATSAVATTTVATLTAAYNGVTKTTTLTATPLPQAALASLTLAPSSVVGGNSTNGTVTLTAAAPATGATVALGSSNGSIATVPSGVTVPAGATSAAFTINTRKPARNTTVTISASYKSVTKTAGLTVKRR